MKLLKLRGVEVLQPVNIGWTMRVESKTRIICKVETAFRDAVHLDLERPQASLRVLVN